MSIRSSVLVPSLGHLRAGLLAAIASLVGCGDSPASPDAAISTVPTSPAGGFAVTSTFDFGVPAAAGPVLATLVSATDGPDDPARFLVDQMISALPDGSVKTIAMLGAPYLASYLNAQLASIAPRLVPGIHAISAGVSRIATHIGTVETLQIDASGAATRLITGVRFDVGTTATTVRLADAGLAEVSVAVQVALDATGHVTIGDHTHALPYGAVLRLGLDRAVAPSVAPGAADLAGALGLLVDCDQLGGTIASYVGVGSGELYGTACRAGMTAIASQIDGQLAAIDQDPLGFEVKGTATGVDLDGDGTMDELTSGAWSGSLGALDSLSSGGAREPLSASSFTANRAL